MPTLVVMHNSSGIHDESGHNILVTHEAETSQQEAPRNAPQRVRFNSSQAAKVGSTPVGPQTRSKTKGNGSTPVGPQTRSKTKGNGGTPAGPQIRTMTTTKANEEERIKELDMQVKRSSYKKKSPRKVIRQTYQILVDQPTLCLKCPILWMLNHLGQWLGTR